jgi:hypothetical protein
MGILGNFVSITSAFICTVSAYAASRNVVSARIDNTYKTKGLSWSRSTTISHSEFDPSQGSGEVISNVNVFNGQAIYQLPLMGINARNVLSWDLSLSYNSGVRPTLRSSNHRSSTGVVGLGWSFTTPFVAVSHMGTVSTLDDVIYCNLGPYGGGQILQNSEGTFFVSTNPYIRVFANSENQTGKSSKISSWTFVMPDGNKMFFGENENSQRTQKSLGNVIAAHPLTTCTFGADFVYKYDISRFTNFDESTEINFEYSQLREPLNNGKSYVRESDVSAIFWKSNGITIDSLAVIYEDKYPFEYTAYGELESKDDQRLYENRFLSRVESYVRGKKTQQISFVYQYGASEVDVEKYHRLLTRVDDYIVGGEEKHVSFNYGNNLLTEVTLPNKVTEHFQYDSLDMSQYTDAISQRVSGIMQNSQGQEIVVPKDKQADFENAATCMEEFCYAELSEKKADDKYDFHVQVYHNRGNYFDLKNNYSVSDWKKPFARYSSNYFVIADKGGRQIDFYEWDGFKFVKKNASIGGFLDDPTKLTGTIEEVVLQNDYALIVEKDKSNDNRYIHIVTKKQDTGDWGLLPTDKTCGFANVADYGEDIRNKNSDNCLEWNNEIFVQASPHLFVVGVKKKDVFNVFSFDGNSFSEMAGKNPNFFPNLGIQKPNGTNAIYSTNFQKTLQSVNLTGNILALTLNKDKKEYAIILFFDGTRFLEMMNESWDVDKSRGNHFLIGGNYALLISNSRSNVSLWRKKMGATGDWVIFDKETDNLFPFDGKNNYVTSSLAEDAFYLEEKVGSAPGRTVITENHYHTLLMKVPRVPTAPIENVPLDPTVVDLTFSPSDPIVLYWTAKYTDDNSLCVTNQPSRVCTRNIHSIHRAYSGNGFFLPKGIDELSIAGVAASWTGDKAHTTPANRLVIMTVLDKNTERNLIRFGQYSGENFLNPGLVPVVSKHWIDDALNGATPVLYTYYAYGNGADAFSGLVEYNTHTQTPQFKNPRITIKTADGTVVSETAYEFVMDLNSLKNKYNGYLINLQGSIVEKTDYDAQGDLRSSVYYNYKINDGGDLKWPNGLVVNLLDATSSYMTDFYGNQIKSVNRNVLLDSLSGQYLGTISEAGDKYLFSQKVLHSQIIPQNGIAYEYRVPANVYSYVPFKQDPQNLYGSSPNMDVSLFPDSVASVSKAKYSKTKPMMPIASYSWQPARKNGKYDPYDGFVLMDTVISMNNYGQVVESQERSVNGMISNCIVYEGLRSLPTVAFSNAACTDVAATTAEHGALNGWEMAQTVLDSEQVYDGLYSFKVVDGYGPTRNIELKELKRFKYNFVISAFAYSTGAKPMLIAEFRKADKSILKSFASFAPIYEPFAPNKWQRYELEIPYDSLVADGMFSNLSEDDHLRIWIGTGTPVNDPSRIIYVDDFVAYPTSSTFAIKSYNEMGATISGLGMTFQKKEMVFDKNHRTRGIRDSKGRIFTDDAMHNLNENLGDHYE